MTETTLTTELRLQPEEPPAAGAAPTAAEVRDPGAVAAWIVVAKP